MRVLVKNNRLDLEQRCDSLSSMDEKRLEKIAASYGIGATHFLLKPVEVHGDKSMEMQDRKVYEKKPRKILEDEIRKRLTVTLDIPKRLWDEEQTFKWESNNVEKMKDITEINRVKYDAGILHELPPFEKGKDEFQTLKMLVELSPEQFQYFQERMNFKENIVVDPETKEKTKKRTRVLRIIAHEWIPESDEDMESLRRKRGTSKAIDESLKKHDKQSKTKTSSASSK